MLMKKFLSLFLCLTCVLTLVACGKKVAPITLPQTDEITSIDITFGENTVSYSDKTWISEIIADISSSEPTKKESVQDCPQVESYIKIDFQFETGTSTIFAYEDSGKYYIEQPYQGIYKIDSQLFERFIRNWLIQVDIALILGNLITVIFDYQILRKPLKILSL